MTSAFYRRDAGQRQPVGECAKTKRRDETKRGKMRNKQIGQAYSAMDPAAYYFQNTVKC